jgi:hypothetical protein
VTNVFWLPLEPLPRPLHLLARGPLGRLELVILIQGALQLAEDILAAGGYDLQLGLFLWLVEFAIGNDNLDILKNDREAPDPTFIPSVTIARYGGPDCVLVCNGLELARRIHKVLADLLRQLDCREEITYTKSEAHGNVEPGCTSSSWKG